MKTAVRWGLYLLGMLVLALGITLNTLTGLGVSPIISVAWCVSQLTGLNFGDMTFLLYALFVAAQFFLRPRGEWVRTALQIPISLLFSRLLNLCSALLPYDSAAHSFAANLVLLAAAILLTGAGVALTVNMELIPNPGDGIVQAIAGKMGRDQGFAKNVFDLGCVAVTAALGVIAARRVIGIGAGTLLAMVGVGRAVALVNHFLRDRMRRAAGVE